MSEPAELDRRLLRHTQETFASDVALIASEFLAGFQAVERIDRPAVSIFGSARVVEGSPTYEAARETARLFAQAGLAVVTGAVPARWRRRIAARGGRRPLGRLQHPAPARAGLNPYCDIALTFKHFYARKTMFVKAAEGFVIFPAASGRWTSCSSPLTLIQTGKIGTFPVVLFDSDYWGEMLDFIRGEMLADGYVSTADLDLLSVTDEPEEAVRRIVTMVGERRAEGSA